MADLCNSFVRFCLKIIPALVPLNPSSCTLYSSLPQTVSTSRTASLQFNISRVWSCNAWPPVAVHQSCSVLTTAGQKVVSIDRGIIRNHVSARPGSSEPHWSWWTSLKCSCKVQLWLSRMCMFLFEAHFMNHKTRKSNAAAKFCFFCIKSLSLMFEVVQSRQWELRLPAENSSVISFFNGDWNWLKLLWCYSLIFALFTIIVCLSDVNSFSFIFLIISVWSDHPSVVVMEPVECWACED